MSRERDKEKITDALIKEREENGIKVIALRSVMLAGQLTRKEKDMPPGAVFMLTEKEFEKLSRQQGEKFNIDEKTEDGRDFLKFIKSQPGGKWKLESLKKKSGPVVKKSKKPLSTREELIELRNERAKKHSEMLREAAEQVEASNG